MHGLASDTSTPPEEMNRPRLKDHDRSGAEGTGGGNGEGNRGTGQDGGTGDIAGDAAATTAVHGAAQGRARGDAIELPEQGGAEVRIDAAGTDHEQGLAAVLRGSRATLEQSLALLRRSAETLAQCDSVLHRSALAHFLSRGARERTAAECEPGQEGEAIGDVAAEQPGSA